MTRKVIFLLFALSTILAAASAAATPVAKALTTPTKKQNENNIIVRPAKEKTDLLTASVPSEHDDDEDIDEIDFLNTAEDDVYDDLLDSLEGQDLDEESLDAAARYSSGRKPRRRIKKAKKRVKKAKRRLKKAKKRVKKARKRVKKAKKGLRPHRRRRARRPRRTRVKRRRSRYGRRKKRNVRRRKRTRRKSTKKRYNRRRRRNAHRRRKGKKNIAKRKPRKTRRKKKSGKHRRYRGPRRRRTRRKRKGRRKHYRRKPRGPYGKPTRRPYTTKPRQTRPYTKPTGYVGGQNDKYPAQCKCRRLPKKGGICYRMKPEKKVGRCKRDDCDWSYECVTGGGHGLKDCYRRYAVDEVRVIQSYKGMHKCKRVKLRKPKVFYSPYY